MIKTYYLNLLILPVALPPTLIPYPKQHLILILDHMLLLPASKLMLA